MRYNDFNIYKELYLCSSPCSNFNNHIKQIMYILNTTSESAKKQKINKQANEIPIDNLLRIKFYTHNNSIDVKLFSGILSDLDTICKELAFEFGIPKEYLIFELKEVHSGSIEFFITLAFKEIGLPYLSGFFKKELNLLKKYRINYKKLINNKGEIHRAVFQEIFTFIFNDMFVKIVGSTENIEGLSPKTIKIRNRLFKKYKKIEDCSKVEVEKGIHSSFATKDNIIDYFA